MKSCAFLLLICLVAICCKKTQDARTATGPTVYISGNNGTNPVLWKNGAAEVLDNSTGYTTQVLLYGNDVYVAGSILQFSSLPVPAQGEYVYWKNGVKTDVSAGVYISTCSIGVSGSDIYFSDPAFFKNGVLTPLPGMGSQLPGMGGGVMAIVTSGGDVYVAGHDSVGDAVYWKNGLMNVVTKGFYLRGAVPAVGCIAVSGSDVYIGGTDTLNRAAIWKNGVETVLQASTGSTSAVWSIFIDGSDVYAAANCFANLIDTPAYWKNGAQINLPLNGASYGDAFAIFVAGNDVYAAGSTSQGAVFWKNGVQSVLSSRGSASSIWVQ